jgi:hypothetical protein
MIPTISAKTYILPKNGVTHRCYVVPIRGQGILARGAMHIFIGVSMISWITRVSIYS